MGQSKRKVGDNPPERSSKKPRTGRGVKVHHLGGSDVAKPVIGTGTALSASLKFSPYTRQDESGKTELLLHSSSHDTIDFNAVESRTVDSNEQHVKHYVAVFDPALGQLNVTEAKKLTVKRQVRKFNNSSSNDGERDEDDSGSTATPPVYSSRVALTEAFGSKKSKKAVATIAENRLIANSTGSDDPLAKAILSTLAEDEAGDGDGDGDEVDPGSSQTNKPLPQANLSATDVADAYPLSTLVVPQPTAATLDSMPIAEWTRRASKKKPISSHYRFIAHRAGILSQRHVEKPGDKPILETLQTLRYIELLLDVHRHVSRLPQRQRLPHTDQWPEDAIKDGHRIPAHVVKQLSIHFFPDSSLTNFALTRLRAFILALTLRIPPGLAISAGPGILAVEPTDVFLDLALDRTQGTRLYRELGCKVESAKEAEVTRWRLRVLEKSTAESNPGGAAAGASGPSSSKKPVFAKLTLPLDFPKLSQGRALSTRGRR
ncbi:hypothetical protein DV735_g2055, partial [Chaetothyriales sp. CBS 134920]